MTADVRQKIEEFIKKYGSKYVWQVDDQLIEFVNKLIESESKG